MDIFDFKDYKDFVNHTIEAMPKKGYGTYRKIAHHLNINSVMVSQIFKGDRHLTSEQAHNLSEFFGLNDLATDYFILLVQIQRAATHTYKDRLEKKLAGLRIKSRDLKTRLPKDKELSDEAKATFYSRWYYSGIRLATSVENLQTPDQLASRLNLSISQINQIIQFLIENGLCIQEGNRIKMGPRRTHIGADSVLVGRHHLNWRMKAMTKIDNIEKDELFYTGPMALSHEMVDEVRKELIRLIERVTEKVVDSKSETLACLNLDWFKI
ncbi:MAG: TIGR02147 family protein [Pseudobdellovibrionaceae bacterium]